MAEHGRQNLTVKDLDFALRIIVMLLNINKGNGQEDEFLDQIGVHEVLVYLDDRICVPRDMGAPPAATIRALFQKSIIHLDLKV